MILTYWVSLVILLANQNKRRTLDFVDVGIVKRAHNIPPSDNVGVCNDLDEGDDDV